MNFSAIAMYALQSSLTLAGLVTLYWLLLRQLSFYRLNRIVLLLVVCATFILPLIRLPFFAGPQIPVARWLHNAHAGQVFEADRQSTTGQVPGGSGLLIIMMLIWFSVCLFLMCRIAYQVITVRQLARTGKRSRRPGCRLIVTEEAPSPFAFFRCIFLHPRDMESPYSAYILRHEEIHAEGWHTIDIMLAEGLTAICWFNPAAWLLCRLLRLNLEQLTDETLLKTGVDRKTYQYSLVGMDRTLTVFSPVSFFRDHQLKDRIRSMNSRPSIPAQHWRYLLFLPLVMLLSAFNLTGSSQPGARPTDMDIYLAIRSDVTAQELRQFTACLAEEGLVAKFDNVSFNGDGALSGLRLSVRQGDKLLGEAAVVGNNGKPLPMPVVFYLLRSDGGKTGVLPGYPQDLKPKERTILESIDGLFKYDPRSRQFDVHGSAHVNF